MRLVKYCWSFLEINSLQYKPKEKGIFRIDPVEEIKFGNLSKVRFIIYPKIIVVI